MATPSPHKPATQPLARVKQYFDRIRLKYIEKTSGNATIIRVLSKKAEQTLDKTLHRLDDHVVLRF